MQDTSYKEATFTSTSQLHNLQICFYIGRKFQVLVSCVRKIDFYFTTSYN